MDLHCLRIFKYLLLVFLYVNNWQQCYSDRVGIIQLNRNWTLMNQNGSIIRHQITIPSGVYSAVCGNQLLHSWNDVRLRWIAYDNWTYINHFSVNPDDLTNIRFANLTLHGIDTVAEIRLNDQLLGRTDNMFVRYSYEVLNILKWDNVLKISITSPVYAALKRANELKEAGIVVPPECPNARYHGECHMNMLRKMQASFGWDWGLAAPSMGIWKSIVFERYDIAIIRDVDVDIYRNGTHWIMDNRVFMDCSGNLDFYAILTFYAVGLLQDPVIITDYKDKTISYRHPVISFSVAIPADKVVLWWPNGYGEQKLYPLHFTLVAWTNKNGPRVHTKIKSEKSIRVGFRSIELIEDAVKDASGNTFLLKINNKEIFMKGSNYIPSHILPEFNDDLERIKHLLESARNAHYNMIRVWGGGIYEFDTFYELCDQYGLLIWQDMMFACAMYPVTDEYLASVRTEISQNALRISHHASIAILAANNENEVALVQNWYETYKEEERFRSEYRKLYLETVLEELNIVKHKNRPQPLVSSPSNGKIAINDDYISRDPQDPNYGDVHFYNVLKDGWNVDIYPRPRFVSEYGFQALPSLSSWLKVIKDNDKLLDLIDHRQHHPLGMLVITNLVRRHFPLPLPDKPTYVESLIYFSQLAQAMAVRLETELYRSLRDTEHHTMGALYWQLNDVWIAPSWSAIDYYGNYKLLYYWSKNFLAPISIIALYDVNTKQLNISLVCDLLQDIPSDVTVSLNIYKWSHLMPRNTSTWPADLKANGVRYYKNFNIDDIITGEYTYKNCFLEFNLLSGATVLSQAFYFPNSFIMLEDVRKPEIKLHISSEYCGQTLNKAINTFSLTITTKYPAIFVYLELLRGDVKRHKFSDNGFMQTSPIKVVHLEFESGLCLKLTKRDIKLSTVNQYLL